MRLCPSCANHDQCGIHRWIEQTVQMFIGEWFLCALKQSSKTTAVTAEDKDQWRRVKPGQLRHQIGERLPARRITNLDDIGLLQVTLGGSAQRASSQQTPKLLGDRRLSPLAMRCMARNPEHLIQARKIRGNRHLLAETLLQDGFNLKRHGSGIVGHAKIPLRHTNRRLPSWHDAGHWGTENEDSIGRAQLQRFDGRQCLTLQKLKKSATAGRDIPDLVSDPELGNRSERIAPAGN